MPHHAAPIVTAEEALERLKEGNARFMRGEARFPTVQKEILADLALGQHPYATALSCSDSRVPPELIFDAGFGELFIIRVAGNVMSPEVAASLQYAGRHLHTPVFVVLGHTKCGAVGEAVEANVRWTMRQIFETPEVQERQIEGVMKLVGAIYEIETGRVRFLD